MISLEEIEREVHDLEARGETTYALCERLAWLYIVRDHLRPETAAPQATQELRGSEFLEAVSGVSFPAAMEVLDAHMAALRVVQPREYEAVMARLANLRR